MRQRIRPQLPKQKGRLARPTCWWSQVVRLRMSGDQVKRCGHPEKKTVTETQGAIRTVNQTLRLFAFALREIIYIR